MLWEGLRLVVSSLDVDWRGVDFEGIKSWGKLSWVSSEGFETTLTTSLSKPSLFLNVMLWGLSFALDCDSKVDLKRVFRVGSLWLDVSSDGTEEEVWSHWSRPLMLVFVDSGSVWTAMPPGKLINATLFGWSAKDF